jgi:hypothetical protein
MNLASQEICPIYTVYMNTIYYDNYVSLKYYQKYLEQLHYYGPLLRATFMVHYYGSLLLTIIKRSTFRVLLKFQRYILT